MIKKDQQKVFYLEFQIIKLLYFHMDSLLRIQHTYNSDIIFLQGKFMIFKGLSKTFSFVVIFRRETWNCTAAALLYTRHSCLFIYFSSVVHVIFSRGKQRKVYVFISKVQNKWRIFTSHSIRPFVSFPDWRLYSRDREVSDCQLTHEWYCKHQFYIHL